MGEQFDLAPYWDIFLRSGRCNQRQFALRRQAGADGDKIDAIEQLGREGAGDELRLRHGGLQRGQALRGFPCIGHAHGRTAAGQPQGHGQARLPKAQYQCGFSVVHHQRSFKVVRPSSTSIMVMIQKRTTTCVSFQPFCSKW